VYHPGHPSAIMSGKTKTPGRAARLWRKMRSRGLDASGGTVLRRLRRSRKVATVARRLSGWLRPASAPLRMFRTDLLDRLHPPLSRYREC
jgi:hypothetical protein